MEGQAALQIRWDQSKMNLPPEFRSEIANYLLTQLRGHVTQAKLSRPLAG